MIKKVRLKFIWITMIAMIVCTVTIVTAINVVNYYQMNQEVTGIVSDISNNDGQFSNKFRSDGIRDIKQDYSAESEYENRYFSVRLFEEDSDAEADLKHIASITSDEAIALANEVVADGSEYGYIGNYKYYVRYTDDYTFVTFLDCETKLEAIQLLAWTSFFVALAGIGLVFVFVAFMSNRAIQPLIESSEKQKRFITDASHELKTPLTVIATNMDILTMDLGENEWVHGTQKQVFNLRKLVNSLVSLSRLEEDNITLEMQKFDLSAALEETITPFAAVAEFEGKNFQVDIQPSLFMEGDESAIRQLASILCDNAIKYASGEGDIHVTLKKSAKKLQFEVSNLWDATADSKTLSRFFDRFYRADESRTKEGGKSSYGIGLSIAKAIVEKHHGKITAQQNENGKISFIVTF